MRGVRLRMSREPASLRAWMAVRLMRCCASLATAHQHWLGRGSVTARLPDRAVPTCDPS